MVELHSAFVWDCDHCGRENYYRAIEGNIDEAALEAADDEWIDPHLVAPEAREKGEGEMEADYLVQRIAIAPQYVTCTHCGETFAAEIATIDEDS